MSLLGIVKFSIVHFNCILSCPWGEGLSPLYPRPRGSIFLQCRGFGTTPPPPGCLLLRGSTGGQRTRLLCPTPVTPVILSIWGGQRTTPTPLIEEGVRKTPCLHFQDTFLGRLILFPSALNP